MKFEEFNPHSREADSARLAPGALISELSPRGARHFDSYAPAPIHRGKGPKSYRRRDERILEDICRRMTDNRYLDASDIEVVVHNGDVVITGTVTSPYQKRVAEDLGDTVYGVNNVENRLRIREE